jgi:hypothetical protein
MHTWFKVSYCLLFEIAGYPTQNILYLADVESTVLKLVFLCIGQSRGLLAWLWLSKPKPKRTASQTFGLAWLDQATAWLLGFLACSQAMDITNGVAKPNVSRWY